MKRNKAKKKAKPRSLPGFAEHERQQILFNLHHSTPLQRLEWLEETLQLLAPYMRPKQ